MWYITIVMKLKIVKDTNPIMRQKSQPVEFPMNAHDIELGNAMLDYLVKSQDEDYAKKHNIRAGVGLAAIQVGELKRMFAVYYANEKAELVQYVLVNPKIIETSIKKCALQNGEGCLSVDKDYNGLSHRYFKIVIKGYDLLQEKEITITARGYDAIVLQHEYDHLDGIFYYDRIDKKNPNSPLPGEQII